MGTRRVARVRGTVQGVGFRWATKAEADRLGVAGSARNLVDGSVEVVAEGDDEAVERLVAWLRVGPRSATVTAVDATTATPEGLADFRIR